MPDHTTTLTDPPRHIPPLSGPRRTPPPGGGADLLAIGLGTATAMWAVGYIGRMPAVQVPPAALAGLLGAVLLAGGFLVGRSTGRGWLGGLAAGLIAAMVNLLIVAGTISGQEVQAVNGAADNADALPTAWGWVPGTLAGTAILMSIAAAVGARFPIRNAARERANWQMRFALVAVAATALLLVAGGLVTGREAGLAVPDWPQSYGYNMLLYPLARMTGNIYYEHGHRLVGVLVGLITLILAIHLWRRDGRRWMRWIVALAVVMVCVQGLMGGLRVALAETGGGAAGVEVATAEHETPASAALRVAHGVFGQIFFAFMVAIAVFTSTAWRRGAEVHAPAARGNGAQDTALTPPNPSLDRRLSVVLLAVLIYQLTLGAMLRHLNYALVQHIAVAMGVLLIAMIFGMRLWGVYGERLPIFRRLGIAMVVVVAVQVGLGFAALAVTRLWSESPAPHAADVIVTSAHQMNGAGLLGLTTAMMLYVHRLLRPDAETT